MTLSNARSRKWQRVEVVQQMECWILDSTVYSSNYTRAKRACQVFSPRDNIERWTLNSLSVNLLQLASCKVANIKYITTPSFCSLKLLVLIMVSLESPELSGLRESESSELVVFTSTSLRAMSSPIVTGDTKDMVGGFESGIPIFSGCRGWVFVFLFDPFLRMVKCTASAAHYEILELVNPSMALQR